MASMTTMAKDLTDLRVLLEALRVDGASQVAVLGHSQYDDVTFLACTDPDGEWRRLENVSGDGAEWECGRSVETISWQGPITILFHSRHELAIATAEPDMSEEADRG